MKMDKVIRGAAAVGQLTELSPWEAEFILNMRLWMDGARGRDQFLKTYLHEFGETSGQRHLEEFERLLTTIHTHKLRPLARHGVACRCIGSDEAVMANLVRFASAGELHEAALIATLLVRPAFVEQVAILAAVVGTATQELTRDHNKARDALTSAPFTLH